MRADNALLRAAKHRANPLLGMLYAIAVGVAIACAWWLTVALAS